MLPNPNKVSSKGRHYNFRDTFYVKHMSRGTREKKDWEPIQ